MASKRNLEATLKSIYNLFLERTSLTLQELCDEFGLKKNTAKVYVSKVRKEYSVKIKAKGERYTLQMTPEQRASIVSPGFKPNRPKYQLPELPSELKDIMTPVPEYEIELPEVEEKYQKLAGIASKDAKKSFGLWLNGNLSGAPTTPTDACETFMRECLEEHGCFVEITGGALQAYQTTFRAVFQG